MRGLKTLGCLLALLLAAIILLPSRAMAADVAINSTNFPDATFRKYVSNNFDKNGDGKLSDSEQEAVDTITLINKGVTSLKGIEYFPNLETLECYGNNIAEIDISGNPFLVLAYAVPYDYANMDGGVYWYQYAEFPEDWDDEELDPDPSAFYDLYFDETTKIIISKPVVIRQPHSQSVGVGKKATFKVTAEGEGTFKYQWQYKKPGGSSWTDVTSAAGKKAQYTFTTAARHDGYKYRCKVSNDNGYGLSREVTLTVVPKPTITTQPKDVTVKGEGTKATIKVVAKGEDLTYTWYVSDPGDNGKFFKSSVKKASYSVSLTKAKNGRKAYVVVTDEFGNSVTSKTVTMDYVTAKPKITSPTKATTKKVAKGKTATFTVKATQGKTYQWQYRTSSSGTWKNVSAASGKTASYKLTVAKKHNGYQYRCKVTNPYGSVYSKIFTLKVTS